MRIATPIAITDAQLVSSNIVEELPYGTGAGVTYNEWSASTTYSAGNQVCYIWTQEAGDTSTPALVTGQTYFGLWTSKVSGNVNRQPGKVRPTPMPSTQPGFAFWTRNSAVAVWDAATTYSTGAIVGRISGGIGAFYQSLQDSNVNQDPLTASAYWLQMPAAAWPGGGGGSVYNEWSGATTYASGAQVIVTAGSISALYTSLQAGNLNKTPASEPTWWEYLGDSYKPWASGTTYAAGDTVLDLRTHHVYESAAGSNLNKDPTNSANVPTWWLDTGPTNKWAMFDQVSGSQTVFGELVDVTVAPGELCDTLALMNMQASEVQVTVTSVSGGGTVYDRTFDLTDPTMVTDWYSYFFDPLTYKAELLILELPPYSDAQIRIQASLPGGQVMIGNTIFAFSETLGVPLVGSRAGIRDYSRKEYDDYGTPSFTERGYAKTMQMQIWVEDDALAGVLQRIAQRRALPTLWIGTASHSSYWIYGIPRDFSGAHQNANVPIVTIEIDGLV